MVNWHTDDSFWEAFAPLMFSPARWENTPAEVDQILELMQPEPGVRLLDMACGPGRHALELARRGFQVTGVDRTERYLQQARKRCREEGLAVDFVLGDMRSYQPEQPFAAALNMFTAFGYFDQPAENQAALANLAQALQPGGRLLIELEGKETLAAKFQPRDWSEGEDGTLYLQDRRIINDWRQIENRWLVIRQTAAGWLRQEFTFRHWLYSAAELGLMLRQAGFAELQTFGSLAGDPYNHTARRLVIVAQRG